MSQAGYATIEAGNLPPEVPLFFEGNSGTGTAISNLFEIVGVGGVTTEVTGNVMTISAVSSGFTWNTVTSATNPTQLVSENGYICSGVSLCTFLLPLAPSVGDTFKVFSYTSRFQIIPNGGQNIVVGAVTGLIGASGTLTSNAAGDQITMTYMGGNTFQSEAPQGVLTLIVS